MKFEIIDVIAHRIVPNDWDGDKRFIPLNFSALNTFYLYDDCVLLVFGSTVYKCERTEKLINILQSYMPEGVKIEDFEEKEG